MTGHHPFKSAEAKAKCMAMFKAREKAYWPIESAERYIDTSYGKTFVRVSGPEDARPLFLLHGIGGNSLDWSINIKELSQEFRTYAVDTIDDFGLSINTTPMKVKSDHAEWLDELFTGLGLEDNINLMGHSYGGWLASQYALRFQQRLNKMILIAPACTIQPIVLQFYIRQILMLFPLRYFKDSFFSWVDPMLKNNQELKEQIDYLETSMKCFKPKYSIVSPNVLSDEELKSIKCKTLILIGDGEKIYSPQKAMDRLKRIAPHINTEVIPDTGHISILQSAEVNEKIISFLNHQGMDKNMVFKKHEVHGARKKQTRALNPV